MGPLALLFQTPLVVLVPAYGAFRSPSNDLDFATNTQQCFKPR
jgi:hypothetical protein